MKQNKIITIDMNVWQTPTSKAKEKGYSTQYISTLIRQGKIKFRKIEELGLVLVARDKPAKDEGENIAVVAAKPIVKAATVNTDYLERRRNAKLKIKE